MNKILRINRVVKSFDKKIFVAGDKSLSIRWVLMASLSKKKSTAYNLLISEDVLSAINCIKKLGSKVKLTSKKCEIIGNGLNLNFTNNLLIDAGNSGTLGRLILGLLINSKKKFKLVGDKSLSKRDFSRIINPLKKFGAMFESKKNRLPLKMTGLDDPKPIKYFEKKGSAQCKSAVMFAGLKAKGLTSIKAKKSRSHTEIMFKHLKIPIKIKKTKNFDYIKLKGIKKVNNLDYKIPGDISSCSFFIVLTILANKSKLLIKNININDSRIGVIHILRKMGASIKIMNRKTYKGEKIGDILVKSSSNLKAINCPKHYNSSAIDEFLIIFLVAAKSNGISYFKGLSELNKKESPRLIWGSKILNYMGVKNILTKDSIKIYGNPNLFLKKNITIKNFLKDHRVFMMSVIAALTIGGNWNINDLDSINTSFPDFLKILKKIEL
jgi:3-phosphoshikimate 1-carboxyvinyltransferase